MEIVNVVKFGERFCFEEEQRNRVVAGRGCRIEEGIIACFRGIEASKEWAN